MGKVAGNGKAGKGISSSFITDIRGDGSDDLNSVRLGRVDDRSATDAVDGYTINQVGVAPFLASTDVASEETEGAGSERRKTKPSNLRSDGERDSTWQQWYRLFWKLKVARLTKNER